MAEFVRLILDYNPDTGIFTWKYRADCPEKWNGRFAGITAGGINKSGHVAIAIGEVRYYAHRLAWLYMTGEWPEGDIDRKDTNYANNKWDNLRLASRSNNMANMRRTRTNTSGYKGVYWSEAAKKWTARITVNYEGIYLGIFDDPKIAHKAYVKAANKYFGEYAHAG